MSDTPVTDALKGLRTLRKRLDGTDIHWQVIEDIDCAISSCELWNSTVAWSLAYRRRKR